ncbi:MAG: hypothetical protein QF362_02305 [Candidatus Woesearchaeota archaeon]|jgi:hypothetical protein|nr:hypothetical protein [Candidatus Woesearchaeota archaeon]|tara:strand:- start:6557 stop:7135 length:579 start_codon:yes stop_codon:yes gene_type:complete
MATPLDVGLVKQFSIILPFLLTFVIVYGSLLYTKSFGENKSLIGAIAVIAGFVVIISPTIREMIDTMVPWFLFVFIFIFFSLMVFKVFGATDSDVMSLLHAREGRTIVTWFITISVIIGIGSLSYVLGQKGGTPFGYDEDENVIETGDPGDIGTKGKGAFFSTLFHPKVLGIVVIFLIAMFTIMRLTYSYQG